MADLQKQVGNLTRDLKDANERQAVIAMENAGLLRELRESLRQQTATADVLKTISRSTFDLQSVLNTLVQSAARLCEADLANIWQPKGAAYQLTASFGVPGKGKELFENRQYLKRIDLKPGRGSLVGRVLLEKTIVQISDAKADPEYELSKIVSIGDYRTMLGVPLLREGDPVGVINLMRCTVQPFTKKQIELVTTFADQAVIAIENARLFDEVQAKTRDLEEFLQQQTATADVLKIISRSAFDLQTVLDALLGSACRLCEADIGTIRYREGSDYRLAATFGFKPEWIDHFSHYSTKPDRGSIFGRTIVNGCTTHIPDVLADPDWRRQSAQTLMGFRAALGVPLVRDGQTFGVISLLRLVAGSFSDKQIELLETFADQAVIAIQNVKLFDEVQAKTRDLEESLQQQTATSEVLQIISSSPGDLAPVFDKMLENATRVCGAEFGSMILVEGDSVRQAALYNAPAALAAARANKVFRPHPEGPLAAAIRTKQAVQDADIRTNAAYLERTPYSVELAELGGARTVATVPMLREDNVIGAITIYRQEVRPFADKQIELVSNFAKQAVIGIENARLLTETREALERQTATAEVLQVINSSPGNLAPVFDAILEKAHSLCGVAQGSLQLYDGSKFRAVAVQGLSDAFAGRLRQGFSPGPNVQRLLDGARFVQIPDLREIDNPMSRAAVELSDIRTALFVPLRKDGTVLGLISASRREVKLFTEKEIGLLESFAAQAVIAMENARLLDEIRHRNDELAEALEFQTATSEVLRIVASSPDYLQPVFDAMLEKAIELCDAKFGTLFLYDGKAFTVAADRNLPPVFAQAVRGRSFSAETNTGFCHLVETKVPVHITDMFADSSYARGEPLRVAAIELGGVRSFLGVPLLRKGELIGNFSIYRGEPGGFAENQIALVTTFADQAVIAIENARLLTEKREALDRQTATAEVLQVINSSRGDLAPVFDLMLQKALSLCGAAFGQLVTFDGVVFRAAAWRGYEPGPGATAPLPGMALHHLVHGEQIVHIPDITADDVYRSGNPVRRRLADEYGGRTAIWVALRKDEELLGAFVIFRTEVRPFSDKQIALLQGFAAQAVIAIENTRLLKETQEALERQTATAELLEVINSSPADLAPVFDAMLEKATRLCGAGFGTLWIYDGEQFTIAATHALPAAFDEFVREPVPVSASASLVDIARGQNLVHVPDLAATELYHTGNRVRRAYVDLGGARTVISVALRKDNVLLGAFNVYRQEVRPFSDKEIALVQNFAAQAVIAIENARLLGELRQRTADLSESLQQQTATADVLKIINRSTVELETVLDTLVETVARLCRADQASLFRQRGDKYYHVASRGLSQEAEAYVRAHPPAPDRGTMIGRVTMERRVVHISDVLQDPEYAYTEGQKNAGFRSMLGVPLLREEALVGIFTIMRTRVEPFTDKEIELATTFADQAVIAIENARLFEELRGRQAELRVTFDNMGDGVVMFDAAGRLTAWNRNFQELIELPESFLAGRPTRTEYFRYLADRGEFVSADLEAQLGRTVDDTGLEMRYERTRPDGRIIEVRRNPVPGGGFVLIYSDITKRKRAEEAIRAARDAAETALRELQKTQASLVHAQKMAALGQLTAGIAHEIKNPLNFVNNFAGLSVELLEELKEAAAEAIGTLDAGKRTEILETIRMLTGNLERIAEHGRRADGIVRGMLQHSRGGSGDWQATDLNALVEESLNLAYHGARAQDQDFKVTLELDLDRNLEPIEVVSQDVSRVLLNFISNGFYAVTKRRCDGDGAFRPLLKIATREFGEAIEIRVRDNGVGIPPENREKLFQPFFTTKPTGEGTGLGLSISYEIITQQHGGTITVDSEVGDFTEFTVRLPRRRHAVA